MAINIDFSEITTGAELSAILQTEFPSQANSTLSSAKGDYKSMTQEGSKGCSIVSSARASVRQAESGFREAMRSAGAAVEEAISEITQKVGSVLAELNTLTQSAIAKVNELAQWAATQVNELAIQPAIAATQSLISTLNNVFNSVHDAISSVISEIGKISNKMLDSLKDMSIKECTTLSEAVSQVPNGSGIESITATQTQDQKNYIRSTMSGVQTQLGNSSKVLNSKSGSIQNPNTINRNITTQFRSIDELIASGI